MNKVLLSLFFVAVGGYNLFGQSKPGNNYLNVGYVSQELKTDEDTADLIKLKSKFGASLSAGRTFFLHKEPVAKVLHFGMDWTYLDLNYSNFKPLESADFDEDDQIDVHKAEAGMQVGPSVHVGLADRFTLSGYFRYAPSYSALYLDEEFSGGFGNFFVVGLTANCGPFGLGYENRWGSSKHSFDGELESEVAKQKINLNGNRVFLAFRF